MKKGERVLEMKDYKKALKYFSSIQDEKFSDDSKARLFRNISKTYLKLEQIDSAKLYSEKSFNVADRNSFIYFLSKAEFELMNHQTSNAIQILQEAEQQFNNTEEIAHLFSQVYTGEYGEGYFDLLKAEDYSVRAFQLKKSNTNKEQLAAVYFEAEKYRLASKMYKEMYFQEPNNNFYQFYYGQALFFDGKENKGFQLMKGVADKNDSCKVMFDEIFSN